MITFPIITIIAYRPSKNVTQLGVLTHSVESSIQLIVKSWAERAMLSDEVSKLMREDQLARENEPWRSSMLFIALVDGKLPEGDMEVDLSAMFHGALERALSSVADAHAKQQDASLKQQRDAKLTAVARDTGVLKDLLARYDMEELQAMGLPKAA
jgi:hypothetical protein